MARGRRSGFRCATCGKWHDHLPTDFGFQLPDEIWALEGSERDRRAKYTVNLCVLDGRRHFIRGVLMVPFTGRDGYFGWGVWVEVSRRDFARYLRLFEKDGSAEPRFTGIIANRLKGYPSSYGKPVEVQLGPKTKRPRLWFGRLARNPLSSEQRRDISLARHHEILQVHMPRLFGQEAS